MASSKLNLGKKEKKNSWYEVIILNHTGDIVMSKTEHSLQFAQSSVKYLSKFIPKDRIFIIKNINTTINMRLEVAHDE